MKSASFLPVPLDTPAREPARRRDAVSRRFRLLLSFVVLLATFQCSRVLLQAHTDDHRRAVNVPLDAAGILEKCSLLETKPGPPPDFYARTQNDRFVSGTKPTLIKNATVWTGEADGFEVVHGDILLDRGLIKQIGDISTGSYSEDFVYHIDAQGKWVSPGIVDLHSHLGVLSVPELSGASDGNSRKGPILPWLRALDALNTRDEAYRLSISGGVTTSLVLPGSANAIGGQAAVIKLRPTAERSPTSMLLENPYEKNTTVYDPKVAVRFRQMKHACGENPDRVYSGTRMDTAWAFRQAYDKARQIKEAQDEFCTKATRGDWAGLGAYPEDLQWEALVDVLRGRVKVHTHCYETVDLDDLVRITNEFKFSIAAFHHAHETYLVPDTLKSAYGEPTVLPSCHPPAAALFASHGRYKREAYRGSEFAPRILADNGIQVVLKSDHPVLDSRFLLWEAQQAYYHGLPHNLALAAVTTTPATIMGQSHRIGFLKEGYDADVVLWDSHPLALGATPQQVWIDGVPQLVHPAILSAKPSALQSLPKVPNFDKEAEEVLQYDGLPPLEPKASLGEGRTVVFANVSNVFVRSATAPGVRQLPTAVETGTEGQEGQRVSVIVRAGKITCIGAPDSVCVRDALYASYGADEPVDVFDLEGGSISPGLTTFGSHLGLEEIQGEASTKDGVAPDALNRGVPSIAGGSGALVRAVDGLVFATRNAYTAYRAGVTTGIVSPQSNGFFSGLNTAFSLATPHKLADGAIVQRAGAVHVSIHLGSQQSVSTQIAALRHLLLNQTDGDLGEWFDGIRKGNATLVVDAESADVIATVVELKKEVESVLGLAQGNTLKVTIAGGKEAHLLAQELGNAGVGVILTEPRPFPKQWEARRILPGPPLSHKSQIVTLVEHNVTVGLGTVDADKARNIRFDAGWAALESDKAISKAEAIALVSTNVEKLLGIERDEDEVELVATSGGDLLEFSKVIGVISPRRGVVDVF
ncbi:composite domain of metallo-dependent hydrolase [Dichomitus squalens LYAD-421 SS1]|uniref:Composite domain of metallo-dependent hydrolase n=1 Tax=Dichomitus squalens (strain LYAD-421) TaxID=732165 RepID=R7T000_DICSQ|nr:composite domain of metallo-dependent hydrolase [Dichomitus squalens LYAD-421 SS1]EJF61656.1 composite domain of metallo-dependent hydrolase [Dichomitus squalens LYAD-421 SS1]